MSRPAFLSPLDLRLYGKRRWITLASFQYQSAHYPKPIVVPAEFVTDLASVPRAPFAYLLTAERAPAPAVIHDWLYQSPGWTDRGRADRIFLEAAGVEQPEFGIEAEHAGIRHLMYAGLWIGGWKAWRDDKRRAALNPIWTREGWPEAP